MKVAFLSSNGVACGIAEYTSDLALALERKGVQTWIVDSARDWNHTRSETIRLVQEERVDVVHIQYETLISGTWERLKQFMAELRSMRPELKVYVTLHRTGEDTVGGAQSIGDVQILVSQDHTFHHMPNVHVAGMGCPVFPERNINQQKAKLGVPIHATLMSTFGFLVKWKRTDEVVLHLAPLMRDDPSLYLQLLCTYNGFADPSEGQRMEQTIRNQAAAYGLNDRLILVTDWLSRDEINERLSASDVGFLFAPMHTGSSSAANKDFIAARVPLVLSDSNHHWDIRQGVIRTTGTLDVLSFVQTLVSVARDKSLCERLRGEMRDLYSKQNWDVAVNRHVELYGAALVPA